MLKENSVSNGIFIGVGSNLGDRLKNLQEAQILLGLPILQTSTVYETEPVGFLEQPWFLNAVIRIETNLSPEDLLNRCQEVERKLQRKREIPKGPRTIDLDILFYNDLVHNTPKLTIPHCAIPERRFVLEPMNEIAPLFVHPSLKQTISQLLAACADPSQVRRF